LKKLRNKKLQTGSMMLKLLIVLSLFACGKSSKKEIVAGIPANQQRLLNKYNEKILLAKSLADPNDGWLEKSECDGMLWAGKYTCGGGAVNIYAAEYASDAGKFNRRPAPYCGEEFGNSKTTWSRDMGMGLITYAWCNKDLMAVERHASYGTKKNWIMGEPFADGRVVYTPSIIGILYQTIYSLGGKDSQARAWPSVYTSGLKDYEAHLQMLDIWLRGEMSGSRLELNLDISQTMFERIKEHSNREPNCPFYSYMRGIYEGNLDPVTDMLVTSDDTPCEYVRGGPNVPLIEWLYTARLTLKKTQAID